MLGSRKKAMMIKIHSDKEICVIEILRPHRANALNDDMANAIVRGVEQNRDSTVIITGSMGHFCNGMDLADLKHAIVQSETIAGPLQALRRVLDSVQRHPRTIAFVNGDAAGGGVGIALLCKYVVAYEGATFRIPGKRVRKFTPIILPILNYRNKDHGLRVGDNFPAGDALDRGLIDEVVPTPLLDNQLLIDRLNRSLESPVERDVDLLREELDDAFAEAARPEAAKVFLDPE